MPYNCCMVYANSTLNDNYHLVKLSIEKGQYLQRTAKQVVNCLHCDFIVYQLHRVLNGSKLVFCLVWVHNISHLVKFLKPLFIPFETEKPLERERCYEW